MRDRKNESDETKWDKANIRGNTIAIKVLLFVVVFAAIFVDRGGVCIAYRWGPLTCGDEYRWMDGWISYADHTTTSPSLLPSFFCPTQPCHSRMSQVPFRRVCVLTTLGALLTY